MMSSQYGPYGLGYTGDTRVMTKRSTSASFSKSQKNYQSTNYSL